MRKVSDQYSTPSRDPNEEWGEKNQIYLLKKVGKYAQISLFEVKVEVYSEVFWPEEIVKIDKEILREITILSHLSNFA